VPYLVWKDAVRKSCLKIYKTLRLTWPMPNINTKPPFAQGKSRFDVTFFSIDLQISTIQASISGGKGMQVRFEIYSSGRQGSHFSFLKSAVLLFVSAPGTVSGTVASEDPCSNLTPLARHYLLSAPQPDLLMPGFFLKAPGPGRQGVCKAWNFMYHGRLALRRG
jgi:hypothetical protein